MQNLNNRHPAITSRPTSQAPAISTQYAIAGSVPERLNNARRGAGKAVLTPDVIADAIQQLITKN